MSVDRLAVMQTFIRVVDTGSFSAAARYLNIGQPAVSQSIRNWKSVLACLPRADGAV